MKLQIELGAAQRNGLRIEAIILERGFEGALIVIIVETANPQAAADAETREQRSPRIDDRLTVGRQRSQVQTLQGVVGVLVARRAGVIVNIVLVGQLLSERETQRCLSASGLIESLRLIIDGRTADESQASGI